MVEQILNDFKNNERDIAEYFAVLSVMVIVGIGMVIYFRKRKWL